MIVITTPTGDIGSKVLDSLLDGEHATTEDLRVVVRDPTKLSKRLAGIVDIVKGSHSDAHIVDRAFDGADAVFWLVPPDPTAPSLSAAYSGFSRHAIEAFAKHEVGHVVGISALGRGTPVARHAGLVTASLDLDDLIGECGVAYRALANPSFMDNVLRQTESIRDDGRCRSTPALCPGLGRRWNRRRAWP
jgi:uncharacterized protein YbjT (DUF2867 family)